MSSTRIGIYSHGEMCQPRADILGMADGTRFIVLHPSRDVEVILHGHDLVGVAQARALAKCLNDAADVLEHAFTTSPPIARQRVEPEGAA